MKLFKKNRRRRSRKSRGNASLILWAIVATGVISLLAPAAFSPSASRVGIERRARATVTKLAVRARSSPTAGVRITVESAAPAKEAGGAGCYRHSQAWVSGNMNIRQRPSTSARILGSTPIGERYAVAGSRKGAIYCWIDIKSGWIAVTNYVSATKPQASQAPVAAPAASNDAAQQALEALQQLTVAPENRCSPYDADDYSYPQSVEAQIISRMGGRIYGPYTGTIFANPKETDIEHIVARSEAHDSGLCSAKTQTRSSFARDLLNLTLASPNVNRRQKVAKDFAEWTPARNKCWYAATIIKVKSKYRLSVDSREKAALQLTLQSCSSLAMR